MHVVSGGRPLIECGCIFSCSNRRRFVSLISKPLVLSRSLQLSTSYSSVASRTNKSLTTNRVDLTILVAVYGLVSLKCFDVKCG